MPRGSGVRGGGGQSHFHYTSRSRSSGSNDPIITFFSFVVIVGLVLFFLLGQSYEEEIVMVTNDTIVWGAGSSTWASSVKVEDVSKSITIYYITEDEAENLDTFYIPDVNNQSETDTLSAARFVYFYYFLNAGSTIHINYSSERGIKLLVFDSSSEFKRWAAGNSNANWYNDYASNSEVVTATLTTKKSSTYYLVFQNTFYFSETTVWFDFSFDKYEYNVTSLRPTCSNFSECIIPLSFASTKKILMVAPVSNNSTAIDYDVKVTTALRTWLKYSFVMPVLIIIGACGCALVVQTDCSALGSMWHGRYDGYQRVKDLEYDQAPSTTKKYASVSYNFHTEPIEDLSRVSSTSTDVAVSVTYPGAMAPTFVAHATTCPPTTSAVKPSIQPSAAYSSNIQPQTSYIQQSSAYPDYNQPSATNAVAAATATVETEPLPSAPDISQATYSYQGT